MEKSLIRRIFTSDSPTLDVMFFNMNADTFARRISRDVVYDLTSKAIQKRGVTDGNIIQGKFFDASLVADDIELDPQFVAALKNHHQDYKNLMFKAVQKESFTQADLQALKAMMTVQSAITIENQNGQLTVNENPVSIILRRLAEGVIDIANNQKDVRICAASDCDIAFVPKRKVHKYHSASCAKRAWASHKRHENRDVEAIQKKHLTSI